MEEDPHQQFLEVKEQYCHQKVHRVTKVQDLTT